MADRPTRREEEASTIPPTMIGVTADMPGGLNQNVDSEGVDWDAAEPEPADDDSGFSITAITRFFPRLQLGKNRSSFSSDTANVLRGRLQAYTLITLLVLVLGFLASLGNDTPLRVFRVIVLLIMATAWWRLRRHQDDSLITLRFIETTCVIALVSQVTAMAWLRIDGFATAGDAASTVGATQFLHTLIAVVVLTYGMFIPNSWWRAASISLPIALVPIGVVFALRSFNPDFVTIEQTVDLSKPIPETLVAAVIAITGSQMIQSVRREAFEAKRLGQYTLLDPIGSGGMGDVYRAEHRMLKRPCAIKLVRSDVSDGETAIQRFEAEVQATAELSHWNSIEVYDYGRTDEGTFYYVMELLPGENLEQIVKQHGPMPPGRVVHLLVQVCDALTEAHSRGLIHRDIKPANIFASERGGVWDVAKLLDFGLVRQSVDSDEETSGFSGTPQYMPPEQITRFDQVDARGDLYALGAVAFHMLTGEPPFQGTLPKILYHHRVTPPPPMPDTPPDLAAVVHRCLQKSPADRYGSAAELRAALESLGCRDQWNDEKAADWWREHPAAVPEEVETATEPTGVTLIAPTLDRVT